MINFKSSRNEKKPIKINYAGRIGTLIDEIDTLVDTIYTGISKQCGKEKGDFFKKTLIRRLQNEHEDNETD